MATIVKRVLGVLLALLGLVLSAVGLWFATQLGSSGTAEFVVHPATADPVLIGPDMLNRVDADVVVTATPTSGGSVWMALANPSDATAVVGGSQHVAVTGASVTDWTLLTKTTGSGAAPDFAAADLWRQQDDAKGPVTLTVKQAGAPETLVVTAQGGQLDTVTLAVTNKSWFVEAVVAALIGLFLIVAGVVLLTSRTRRHPGPVAVPPVPVAPDAPAGPTDPEGAIDAEGTIDPDRTVGAGDGAEPTAPLTLGHEPGPDSDLQHDSDSDDPTSPTDPQEVTR